VADGVAAVTDIPTIAVGYTGWKDVWGLKKQWENTDTPIRPDAAYTIEEGAFVSETLWAEKHAALFALIAFLSQRLEDQSLIKTNWEMLGPLLRCKGVTCLDLTVISPGDRLLPWILAYLQLYI
jgi:hypothetical protein